MDNDQSQKGSQYLSFSLEDEFFAIDIGKVKEVLEFSSVTKVPRAPEFMRGVINLRGFVVPVVDLKLKFGMGVTEKTVNTCVIIAEINVDGDKIVLGCLADAVQEVFDLDSESIEPPPKIGTRLNTAFIQGMGKRDDKFMIILDVDKLFTAEDITGVKSAG